MKKMMEKICSWLRRERQRAAEEREKIRGRRLSRESRRAVQVMEFEGDVWLSLDGVPVLPVGALAWDLATTLTVSREAWAHFKGKEADDGRA